MYKGTIVNGKWVIDKGLHKNQNIDTHFLKTMKELNVR